jgi:hypothetical protein
MLHWHFSDSYPRLIPVFSNFFLFEQKFGNIYNKLSTQKNTCGPRVMHLYKNRICILSLLLVYTCCGLFFTCMFCLGCLKPPYLTSDTHTHIKTASIVFDWSLHFRAVFVIFSNAILLPLSFLCLIVHILEVFVHVFFCHEARPGVWSAMKTRPLCSLWGSRTYSDMWVNLSVLFGVCVIPGYSDMYVFQWIEVNWVYVWVRATVMCKWILAPVMCE